MRLGKEITVFIKLNSDQNWYFHIWPESAGMRHEGGEIVLRDGQHLLLHHYRYHHRWRYECGNDVGRRNGPLTSKTKAKSQIRTEPFRSPPSAEPGERSADFHHFIRRLLLHTWPHSLVIEQEMSLIVASCLHPSNRLCTDRCVARLHPIWASPCLLCHSSPAVACCITDSFKTEWNHLHVSDLWHLRELSEEMAALNDSITSQFRQRAQALGARVSLKAKKKCSVS